MVKLFKNIFINLLVYTQFSFCLPVNGTTSFPHVANYMYLFLLALT